MDALRIKSPFLLLDAPCVALLPPVLPLELPLDLLLGPDAAEEASGVRLLDLRCCGRMGEVTLPLRAVT